MVKQITKLGGPSTQPSSRSVLQPYCTIYEQSLWPGNTWTRFNSFLCPKVLDPQSLITSSCSLCCDHTKHPSDTLLHPAVSYLMFFAFTAPSAEDCQLSNLCMTPNLICHVWAPMLPLERSFLPTQDPHLPIIPCCSFHSYCEYPNVFYLFIHWSVPTSLPPNLKSQEVGTLSVK